MTKSPLAILPQGIWDMLLNTDWSEVLDGYLKPNTVAITEASEGTSYDELYCTSLVNDSECRHATFEACYIMPMILALAGELNRMKIVATKKLPVEILGSYLLVRVCDGGKFPIRLAVSYEPKDDQMQSHPEYDGVRITFDILAGKAQ